MAFGSATVVAAKVVNFEDLAAFIPGDGIAKLVEQVTRRLQLASQGTTLHHDLDGTFAWLVPYYQHSQIEAQLAGLAALFNAPDRKSTRLNSSHSCASRMPSSA